MANLFKTKILKSSSKSRRNLIFCSISAMIAAGFLGCTKKSENSVATESKKIREVNLAIWGNYFETSEQERFAKKTGIKINITNFSSNEELLAKVQSGASGLDLAIPSDYMVAIMIKLGLLEKLPLDKIPGQKEIIEDLLKRPFDPENAYSLPYAWTTSGIAIRRDLYKGKVLGWKDVMNDASLKGKISLLDDVRESLGVALKLNGLSVNSNKPEDLAKAKKTLLELKKNIKMFRSDMVDPLVNKEVAVGQAYGTEALKASAKVPGLIEYVLPEEGGTWSIDNMVIVKGSKNSSEVVELINFFLDLETNVNFVTQIRAGPVLKKTREKLPEELKNNPGLFPTKEQMSKLEPIQDLGEATQLVDRIWTEVKSE